MENKPAPINHLLNKIIISLESLKGTTKIRSTNLSPLVQQKKLIFTLTYLPFSKKSKQNPINLYTIKYHPFKKIGIDFYIHREIYQKRKVFFFRLKKKTYKTQFPPFYPLSLIYVNVSAIA